MGNYRKGWSSGDETIHCTSVYERSRSGWVVAVLEKQVEFVERGKRVERVENVGLHEVCICCSSKT